MTEKQIIISDYFTATLTLPEKIVEYQLKPCRDNQLVDKINEQNSYLKRKDETLNQIRKIIYEFARTDIFTSPDLKPKENYEIIQKQCTAPLLDIVKLLNEDINNDR